MTAFSTAVVTAVTVAFVLWVARVPAAIRTHDRLLRDSDEDLSSWVADRHMALKWDLKRVMDDLARDRLLDSGERLYRRAVAKERALHEWRDEARKARRFRAELLAQEEWPHRLWRRITSRPAPGLSSLTDSERLISTWREPESYEGSPVRTIVDPTQRTIDSVDPDLNNLYG